LSLEPKVLSSESYVLSLKPAQELTTGLLTIDFGLWTIDYRL